MRHARSEALDDLEDVLSAVRRYDALTERKRGTFYRKSLGFLHFHEDPAGLFADVKVGGEWERFRVSTTEERIAMLGRLEVELGINPVCPDVVEGRCAFRLFVYPPRPSTGSGGMEKG